MLQHISNRIVDSFIDLITPLEYTSKYLSIYDDIIIQGGNNADDLIYRLHRSSRNNSYSCSTRATCQSGYWAW